MQTKKEEIREEILAAANQEFLKKGFKSSSMRTIAKYSNTTLGNLYNYFASKEAILDAIVGSVPGQIDAILENHRNYKIEGDINRDNYEEYMEELIPKFFPLDVLLDSSFIILMDRCEGTKYEPYKEKFVHMFAEHLGEHINKEGTETFLTLAMAHGFLSALLLIAKSKKGIEQRKLNLTKYITAMCFGIVDLNKC